MIRVINKQLLSQLLPEEKPYEVRDVKLTGFLLRVQPTGRKTYICQYARGRRKTIGDASVLTPYQARDRAQKILAEFKLGIDPGEQKEKVTYTLSSFLEREYKPWTSENFKTGRETVDRVTYLFIKEFGGKKLDEINQWIIDKWTTKRIKSGTAVSTIHRDVASLRSVLTKAVEWGFITSDPLKDLKLPKMPDNMRVRYLAENEELALRKALEKEAVNGHLKPMVLLSLNTGIRQGELFKLRWSNIDLVSTTPTLTVSSASSKNSKSRSIPLNTEAKNCLETLHHIQEQPGKNCLVFPNKYGKPFTDVKRAFATLLKRASIENFRWHDLRHHFASRLAMSKMDLNTIRELLGHGDLKMTLRYTHLAPEHKYEAVQKLDAVSSSNVIPLKISKR